MLGLVNVSYNIIICLWGAVKYKGWAGLGIQRLAFPWSCLGHMSFWRQCSIVLTSITGQTLILKPAGPTMFFEIAASSMARKPKGVNKPSSAGYG